MVMGFVMTFALILSLFAGIGAIWVNEDVSKVSAGEVIVDSNGKYTIPRHDDNADLGTDANPFVVLEIVPNENMAQFGYLVGGQEPINVSALQAADIAAGLAGGTQLSNNIVNSYKWLKWVKSDKILRTEFVNMLPTDSEVYATDAKDKEYRIPGTTEKFATDDDGNDYKITDTNLSYTERAGEYTQYGYFRLAPKDAEGNPTGNYRLKDDPSEVETIGDGYGYYRERSIGEAGADYALLTEEEISSLDKAKIEELTGKAFDSLVAGVDYVIDETDKSIYVKVAEGTGVYSDKEYDRIQYSVTFKVDGKVYKIGDKEYKFTDILAGEKLTADQKPANPVKEGNTFSYWAKEGESSKFDLDTEVITGDTVLVAKWNVVSYKVHFNTAGGTAIPDAEVEYDTPVAQPADPEKSGHTFLKWCSDSELKNDYDFSSPIKEETTIYAKYKVNTYTVTFDLGIGSGHATPLPDPQTVEYQKYATEPTAPTWRKHKFQGWMLNGSLFNFATTKIEDNITLTAKWDDLCQVSFNLNGGTLNGSNTVEVQNVVKGQKATDPGSPTRNGCNFAGWFKEGSTTAFRFGTDTVDDDITLTAQWYCTVTFNSDGGSAVTAQDVPYGTKATQPENPSKEGGFEFLGWKKNTSDTEYFDFENTDIIENTTLTAIWHQTSHKVTFKLNGGYIGTGSNNGRDRVVDNITHGTLIGERYPGQPSKSGSAPNTFKGWKIEGTNEYFDISTRTIEQDLVLVAIWGFKVSFDMTYGTPQLPDVVVEAGEKVTEPDKTSFSRDKYVFIEWRTGQHHYDGTRYDFDSEVNSDLTLLARWGHTITFNSNGGSEVPTQTVEGDSKKADKPDDPTKTGFVFKKWQLNGKDYNFDSQVKDNIQLDAVWANAWTVTFDTDGGSAIDPIYVENNTKFNKPTNPTKDGYIFDRWINKSNNKNFDFGPDGKSNENVKGNLTLKATWKEAYIVTFDTNGGSTIDPVLVEKGKKVAKPANPTKTGYTFKEWRLVGSSSAYNFNSNVNSNITLRAVWQKTKVTYYYTYSTTTGDHKEYDDFYYNDYYIIFREANNSDFEDLNKVIYSVKGKYPVNDYFYYYYNSYSYQGINLVMDYHVENNAYVFSNDNGIDSNKEYIVLFAWCEERPSGQPDPSTNPTADQKYYVFDSVLSYSETNFNQIKSAYGITDDITRDFYRWMSYDVNTNGTMLYTSLPDIRDNTDEVVSFASMAVSEHRYGNKIVTSSKVTNENLKTNKKNETQKTKSFASGSGDEEAYINSDYYNLAHTIDISKGELPVIVDESDGKKAGNKNYVRFVIKNKIAAEKRHNFTMIEAVNGEYIWVGKTFENNEKVKEENTSTYLDYFKNHLTNIPEEDLDDLNAALAAGTGDFKKLYGTLDVKVRDYFAKKLVNTELFKKNAIGLAYKAGNISKYDTESYEFINWYTDKYGVNAFTNDRITSNVTLYGKWKEKISVSEIDTSCRVIFQKGLDGDIAVENMPQEVTDINNGAYICAPNMIPIADGKIFDCWLDADTNEKFDFEKTPITKQFTYLKASWKDMGSEKFTFHFDPNISSTLGMSIVSGTWPLDLEDIALNGRKVVEAEGATVYQKVGAFNPKLEKDGIVADYIFAGWYLDSECTGEFSFDNAQNILEQFKEAGQFGITLYARWIMADNLPSYTVKFITNEPSSANAKATGLDKYFSTDYYDNDEKCYKVTVEYGKRAIIVQKKRKITDLSTIKPSLKGNIEDKIEKYKVQVITVTPEDLGKTGNLELIDRANLIVLSQARDADLINIWNNYKNTDLFFEKNPSEYNLTATSFVDNDLDWNTTERILSRITGVRKSGTSVLNVSTCPVLYDYSIYENVSNASGSSGVKKQIDATLKLNGGDISKKANGFNSNIYKLYLMTQQTNPMTLFNAYIRNKATGTISNGTFSGGYVSGDNSEDYWNEYTLVPWNVIKYADYSGSPQNSLALIGFTDDIEPEADKSKLNNRVFIYNTSDSNGFAKDIDHTVLDVHPEMSDVFGASANTRNYSLADVIYYLLNSKTQSDNYSHDLHVLDIEPGSNGRPSDYWFWYISRYVPNYTGTTTVTQMSTSEFICNIDDLNSQYDVIFFGVDTGIKPKSGTVSKSVSYRPESKNEKPDVEAKSYKISTDNGNTYTTGTYKLINVIKGVKPDQNYYVVNKVIEPSDDTFNVANISSTDVNYVEKWAWNVVVVADGGTSSVRLIPNEASLKENLGELYNSLEFEVIASEVGNSDSDTMAIRLSTGSGYKYYKLPIQLKIKGDNTITVNLETAGVGSDGGWGGYPDYVTREWKVVGTHNGVIGQRFVEGYGYGTDWHQINGQWKHGRYEDIYGDIDDYGWSDWEKSDYMDGTPPQAQPRIAFNLKFKYKRNSHSETCYQVTQANANSSTASAGQIFITSDTKIKCDLVYSHIGTQTTIDDERADYGLVSGNDDKFDVTVHSGNDITFKKYKEIAKFLEAKYPVILSKELFISPDEKKINPYLVDTASWMYKLLSELTTYNSGSPYYWFREDDSSQDSSFRKALSNKTFYLEVEKAPKQYRDLTNADSIREHLTPADVYINGTDSKNRTMEFNIKIISEKTDGRYMLRMFTDTNADGRYDIENEMLDSVQIKDISTGRSGIAASMILQAGHTYQVSRTLSDDYAGIIPWKLQVLEVDSSNQPTGVYDDETGMAAIKVDKKEKLYVLQITSEKDANTGSPESSGKQFNTNVFFPTDEEIKNGFSSVDIKGTTWNNALIKQNMQQFYYYTSILEEFEVHFLRVSIDKRTDLGYTDTRVSLKDIANDTTSKIGTTYVLKDGTWDIDKEKVTWSDINMLILGYADCYNDITDAKSLALIKDFIEGGKTTLFTHDTTSPVNGKFIGNSYYQKWGKNINEYFRDFLGMDRFHVMKNKGSSTTDQVIGRSKPKDSSGAEKDFTDIGIANANEYSLDYDVPFATNTTMKLASGNLKTSKNSTNTSDFKVLTQGLTNRIMVDAPGNNNPNSVVTRVTQNNSGQIVVYPYTIGTKSSNRIDNYAIDVGNTHSQYYQLNMEDEEIVVWYSLYHDNGYDFQNLLNDGSNNYYIYNKGNITYSGVGHQAEMTDEEYKLFVNTMIAAYNSRVRATEPEIRNSDRSTDNNDGKDYIYVDFDATVGEEDAKQPVGGDVEEKYVDANGNNKYDAGETKYYTKRVEFTLRNFSIIMHKFMTVHAYPVVYDKSNGNRVVLYDYPIPLTVKKKDNDNNDANDEEAKKYAGKIWDKEEIKTSNDGYIDSGTGKDGNYTNVAFGYSMPAGLQGKTADERAKWNYAVVGVSKDVYEVESLVEYYVDIPITNDYYSKVLNLPDSITYKPTKNTTETLYSVGAERSDHSIVQLSEADYNKNEFGLDLQNHFEIEIQIVMRYGRDEKRNRPYVGTRAVEFMRRGMFSLD